MVGGVVVGGCVYPGLESTQNHHRQHEIYYQKKGLFAAGMTRDSYRRQTHILFFSPIIQE